MLKKILLISLLVIVLAIVFHFTYKTILRNKVKKLSPLYTGEFLKSLSIKELKNLLAMKVETSMPLAKSSPANYKQQPIRTETNLSPFIASPVPSESENYVYNTYGG